MKFIKVGDRYINFDRVDSIDALGNGNVCLSFPEGAIWLEGVVAKEFMVAVGNGLLQSPEEKAEIALANIYRSIGNSNQMSDEDRESGIGTLLGNLDHLVRRIFEMTEHLEDIADKLGWLKELAGISIK